MKIRCPAYFDLKCAKRCLVLIHSLKQKLRTYGWPFDMERVCTNTEALLGSSHEVIALIQANNASILLGHGENLSSPADQAGWYLST
jgi:hypothetical protein